MRTYLRRLGQEIESTVILYEIQSIPFKTVSLPRLELCELFTQLKKKAKVAFILDIILNNY